MTSLKLQNGLYLLRCFKPVERQGDGVVRYYISNRKSLSCRSNFSREITPKLAFQILTEQVQVKSWHKLWRNNYEINSNYTYANIGNFVKNLFSNGFNIPKN